MKKKLILFLVVLMGALALNAHNGKLLAEATNNDYKDSDAWLLLWHKNGEIAAYHVNTHPRIKYHGGDFLIISDEVEIAYPSDDVRKFTLCKDLADYENAIGRVPEDNWQNGCFEFNKARPGSIVNIYDSSGRKVDSHTVGADGSLQYSLDNYPAGVYIIKTETTNIKIIKK